MLIGFQKVGLFMKQKGEAIDSTKITIRNQILNLIQRSENGISVNAISVKLGISHKQVLSALSAEDLIYEESRLVFGKSKKRMLFLVAVKSSS